MKPSTRRLAPLALAMLAAFNVHAKPAAVWVYVYEQAKPQAAIALEVDDKAAGTTAANGAVGTSAEPGTRTFTLKRGNDELLEFDLELADGEEVQVSAALTPGRAPIYTVRSNLKGEKTIDLAPPAAAPSAVAPAGVTPDGAQVLSEVAVVDDTPESETTLQGVTVTGQTQRLDDQAAYQDERRASAQVSETLSTEQISRAGDSDSGAALKRVTGLSLVDGKYVYVRGLGERYSSVLLNGAQIPSPDPTRRVVPLDLFPTEMLEGVVVQKSYSPDMPGEFGGGTIQLRTRAVPDKPFAKVSLGLGWVDGTTFDDGLRHDGGNRDWTGYDDGARELPASIAAAIAGGGQITPQTPFNPDGFTPAEIETFGEDLAAGGFDTRTDPLPPNGTFAAAVGNGWDIFNDMRFGVLAALRYDHKWDNTLDEQRRVFAVQDESTLVPSREFERDKTERVIELGAFVNLGLEINSNHKLGLANLLVRQTEDETRIDEGYFDGDIDQQTRVTRLEWEENELRTHQLSGQHSFPTLAGLKLDWQYTLSKAGREAPFTRDYRFDLDQNSGDFQFSTGSSSNQISFSTLDDDADEYQLRGELPLVFGDNYVTLSAGGSVLDRDRESEIRRFQYLAGGPIASDPNVRSRDGLDAILTPATIGSDGFFLREVTRGTDNYVADQKLDAAFLAADVSLGEKWRFAVGARREDNEQNVTTFSLNPADAPLVSTIAETDWLPSLAVTWLRTDDSQWRFAYAETLSRPDFRELSASPFTEPLLDVEAIGNPDLVQTEIQNVDLRYEYYFSPTEIFAASLFYKKFKTPIERITIPGTLDVVSFANADGATNYGAEIEVFKYFDFMADTWLGRRFGEEFSWESFFIGANYAWIDSEIELGESQSIQTNEVRPLQGQSRYLVNLQLGYQSPAGDREATLLFNRFGRRISQVGTSGAPDIYEESVNQLDFVYSHNFAPDWAWKLRLRNLLDPNVEYSQGGLVTREFKRGREVLVTLEWRPSFD